MAFYTDEEYTREKDGRVYKVKLEAGYDLGADWMGEYTDKDDDYIVDRREGVLYGAWDDEPEHPEPEDYEGGEDGEAYQDALDVYDEAFDAWEDGEGREILADCLPTSRGRREYRYFKPYAGGYASPIDAKWTGQDGKTRKVSVEEWAKWATQDYRRVEGLNRGDWCFVTIVVTVDAPRCDCCGHVETLISALGGIESDAGDEYFEEVIRDCIGELERELKKFTLVKEVK